MYKVKECPIQIKLCAFLNFWSVRWLLADIVWQSVLQAACTGKGLPACACVALNLHMSGFPACGADKLDSSILQQRRQQDQYESSRSLRPYCRLVVVERSPTSAFVSGWDARGETCCCCISLDWFSFVHGAVDTVVPLEEAFSNWHLGFLELVMNVDWTVDGLASSSWQSWESE